MKSKKEKEIESDFTESKAVEYVTTLLVKIKNTAEMFYKFLQEKNLVDEYFEWELNKKVEEQDATKKVV